MQFGLELREEKIEIERERESLAQHDDVTCNQVPKEAVLTCAKSNVERSFHCSNELPSN